MLAKSILSKINSPRIAKGIATSTTIPIIFHVIGSPVASLIATTSSIIPTAIPNTSNSKINSALCHLLAVCMCRMLLRIIYIK